MTIGIQEDRPPYVTFETRAEEDRQESINQGRMICKNVDYAIITPRGSKDRIERVASEWLAHIDRESRQDRFDPRWVQGYKQSFALWKEGQQAPVEGTPITEWPGLSPAQVRNYNAINIRSVEDIAEANEETLARMGFGARDLKNRAQNWLKAASTTGISAETLSALEAKNASLEATNKTLQDKLDSVLQRLSFLEANGGNQISQGNSQSASEPRDVEFD